MGKRRKRKGEKEREEVHGRRVNSMAFRWIRYREKKKGEKKKRGGTGGGGRNSFCGFLSLRRRRGEWEGKEYEGEGDKRGNRVPSASPNWRRSIEINTKKGRGEKKKKRRRKKGEPKAVCRGPEEITAVLIALLPV